MATRSRRFGWMLGAISLAATALVAACGARSSLLDPVTRADGSGGGGAGGDTGGGQAGGDTGGAPQDGGAEAQCLCPDEPGYAPCVLPLMCCPCVAHCEDPATFNCSCTNVPTCQ